MANRYWVGGTGNWSDNAHWATVSGGTGGASIPTSADNVYFDANSFTSAGQTVTVNETANCLDMDWTGATNSPTLAGSSSLRVYKSLTFISAINYTHTGFIFFYGSSTGMTITSANKAFNANIGNASAEWILQDDLNCVGKNLSFYSGTLRANGKSITCNNFNSSASSIRTLDLGTSTMTVSGKWDCLNSTNFTLAGGNIVMTGAGQTFDGGGSTYHNVELQGDNCTITGSNTFNELKVKAGNTAIMTAGTIQTVNSLAVDGTSENLTTIQSTEAGNPFILRSTSDIAVNNCTIKDCVTTSGATYKAYNSVDGGGNSGWTFYDDYSGIGLHVDANGILQPLGVKVLRGVEFIKNTREYSDKVPGRDGEYYFGSEIEAGLITLPCFVETTPLTWDAKETEIMGYLNPKLGEQALTFANRPGKVFYVVYAGQLKFTEEGPNYRKFTIPFKYHTGNSISSTQSTLTGSGTAVNGGNDVCPVVVEIVGPVTNPSVTVAGKTMTYTGTVTANDKLIIDTEKMTCTFNGANALASYNGVFPKLAIGNNTVTAASAGTTTVKWYNRWQ